MENRKRKRSQLVDDGESSNSDDGLAWVHVKRDERNNKKSYYPSRYNHDTDEYSAKDYSDSKKSSSNKRNYGGGKHGRSRVQDSRVSFKHHYTEWPDRKKNPHLQQALAYHDTLIVNQAPFDQNSRLLSDSAPRLEYQRRKGQLKSVLHWGQRKLLLSEIEFLTNYGEAGRIVLYAGAAPGTHTNYLSELFPELTFVLVDPSHFETIPTDRIKIIQDFFTDDIAYKYRGLGVLFISDIRTASWSDMKEEDVEAYVESDNIAQMRWHGILRPLRSMLKFRLPYVDERTDAARFTRYLDGEVYLPIWGPQTTSETRLVPCACPTEKMREAEEERKKHTLQVGQHNTTTTVGDTTNENESSKIDINASTDTIQEVQTTDLMAWCPMRDWDNKKYEDQMYYFNTVTRVTYYDHQVEGDGIDHCFDCRSEIYVLQNYLIKSGKLAAEKAGSMEANKMISAMSYQISKQCSRQGRMLSTPQPKPYGASRGRRDRPNLPAIYDTGKIIVDKTLVEVDSHPHKRLRLDNDTKEM
jgi:hypothetical protein